MVCAYLLDLGYRSGLPRHSPQERHAVGELRVARSGPPLVHFDDAGVDELKAGEPADDLGAVAQEDRDRRQLVPAARGLGQPLVP